MTSEKLLAALREVRDLNAEHASGLDMEATYDNCGAEGYDDTAWRAGMIEKIIAGVLDCVNQKEEGR